MPFVSFARLPALPARVARGHLRGGRARATAGAGPASWKAAVGPVLHLREGGYTTEGRAGPGRAGLGGYGFRIGFRMGFPDGGGLLDGWSFRGGVCEEAG